MPVLWHINSHSPLSLSPWPFSFFFISVVNYSNTLSLWQGNCNIFMKRKISVINETKWDKILWKLKVCDQEKFCGVLLTFITILDKSWPTFGPFSVHKWKLTKFRNYFVVFPSHFYNIFLKSFRLLQNFTRNWEILQ